MNIGKDLNECKSIITSLMISECVKAVDADTWSHIREIIPIPIFELFQQYNITL